MRDADVRAAVRTMLARRYESDPNTKIVEEMGVWSGSVRIDLAVINGELNGYELKSDRDTLDRLPFQVQLYSRVFDHLFLVVGKRHAEKAIAMLPPWWGVMVAEQTPSGLSLIPTRDPEQNPAPDPYLVAQLLWKDEALSVLDRFNLAKGWRSKPVRDIHHRLASEIQFDELATQVRSTLKHRENWLGQRNSNQLYMPIDTKLNPVL